MGVSPHALQLTHYWFLVSPEEKKLFRTKQVGLFWKYSKDQCECIADVEDINVEEEGIFGPTPRTKYVPS